MTHILFCFPYSEKIKEILLFKGENIKNWFKVVYFLPMLEASVHTQVMARNSDAVFLGMKILSYSICEPSS